MSCKLLVSLTLILFFIDKGSILLNRELTVSSDNQFFI